MDESYIDSMTSHVREVERDLLALTDLIRAGSLSRFEYRAAERSLQVLIEACIGIAKHWAKQEFKTAPVDAFGAFKLLIDHTLIDQDPKEWRKVIAMRNALVHDYLNIDSQVVEAIIKEKVYERLVGFALAGLSALKPG
jgi:uncharacterized protein YutE (UPF0331/DUF86 family)